MTATRRTEKAFHRHRRNQPLALVAVQEAGSGVLRGAFPVREVRWHGGPEASRQQSEVVPVGLGERVPKMVMDLELGRDAA